MIEKLAMVPYDPQVSLGAIAGWTSELSAPVLAAVDSFHAADMLDRERRAVKLFHLVVHGTHHRAQVIKMLRLLRIDPPFESGGFWWVES